MNKEINLGFTNKCFKSGIHMCLIYRDEEERREIISKYLSSGLQDNEKIVYFTNIMSPQDLKYWLETFILGEFQNEISKRFEIYNAKNIYCPSGKFLEHDMLDKLKKYYKTARESGYEGVRITGETGWIKELLLSIENFLSYESGINRIVEEKAMSVMCQYDVRDFSGGQIFDILQVHPLLVVHGQIVENPAYVTPEELNVRYLDHNNVNKY